MVTVCCWLGNFSGILLGVAIGSSWQNVVLGIRNGSLGMGLGWGQGQGWAEGFHRKWESKMFHQDLPSPLEMGSESEEGPNR